LQANCEKKLTDFPYLDGQTRKNSTTDVAKENSSELTSTTSASVVRPNLVLRNMSQNRDVVLSEKLPIPVRPKKEKKT